MDDEKEPAWRILRRDLGDGAVRQGFAGALEARHGGTTRHILAVRPEDTHFQLHFAAAAQAMVAKSPALRSGDPDVSPT